MIRLVYEAWIYQYLYVYETTCPFNEIEAEISKPEESTARLLRELPT